MRFYEPVWEFEGYQLVKRPDTSNYYIYHRLPNRPTRRVSTRTDEVVSHFVFRDGVWQLVRQEGGPFALSLAEPPESPAVP